MEIKIIVVCIAVIILTGIFWFREYKKRLFVQNEEAEKDEELTRYTAENIDLRKELSEIKKEYEVQQGMAAEIEKIQAQSRLLKHDMKNHSLVILSYLEEGKAEEAKQYTSKILDNLNKIYTYIHVGNSLMNYILNNKLSKAKEMGIEIKAEIENLAFEYMDSVDFSALLNNMLDNAVEGAANSAKKEIKVIISNQKGFDSIMVKNSIDSSVLENNPQLHSTKNEEGHGFGIRQVRTITEKYNGMIDIYEDESSSNRMFVINVVYPC